MIDDPFALLAELALGLAGFAGVAAAFGGREREFRPTELVRLRSLFMSAALILSGCGCIAVMSTAGASANVAHVVAATLTLVLFLGVGGPLLVGAFRRARDVSSTSEPWALWTTLVQYVATAVLIGSSIVTGGEGWPLLAGYWLQLLHGLWMFTRLLTRPN